MKILIELKLETTHCIYATKCKAKAQNMLFVQVEICVINCLVMGLNVGLQHVFNKQYPSVWI